MIQIVGCDQALDTSQFEYQTSNSYQNKIKSAYVSYHNKKLMLQSPEMEVLPKIFQSF